MPEPKGRWPKCYIAQYPRAYSATRCWVGFLTRYSPSSESESESDDAATASLLRPIAVQGQPRWALCPALSDSDMNRAAAPPPAFSISVTTESTSAAAAPQHRNHTTTTVHATIFLLLQLRARCLEQPSTAPAHLGSELLSSARQHAGISPGVVKPVNESHAGFSRARLHNVVGVLTRTMA